LYIDGVLRATDSSADIINMDSADHFRAGVGSCDFIDGTVPFAGTLDEIEIYGRALSGDDIQQIYRAAAVGPSLRIESVSVSGANFGFSWNSASGHIYHVQFKAAPGDATWTLVENIPGNGNSMSRSYPIGNGSGFYRITVD